MSVLIWVQTVCKDYQQTTKIAAGKERLYIQLGNSFQSHARKMSTLRVSGQMEESVSEDLCLSSLGKPCSN